jgi:hypothetical protein
MFTNAQKINLIEGLLKTSDERILHEVETILNKKTALEKKKTLADFVGVWNKKDTATIQKAISETCEQINESDWK